MIATDKCIEIMVPLIVQLWPDNTKDEAIEIIEDKGCKEFASDCEITNEDSFRFHLNIGFDEENRIICFKKEI